MQPSSLLVATLAAAALDNADRAIEQAKGPCGGASATKHDTTATRMPSDLDTLAVPQRLQPATPPDLQHQGWDLGFKWMPRPAWQSCRPHEVIQATPRCPRPLRCLILVVLAHECSGRWK